MCLKKQVAFTSYCKNNIFDDPFDRFQLISLIYECLFELYFANGRSHIYVIQHSYMVYVIPSNVIYGYMQR